ncbi:ABC transporter permease [Macrococcus equipercicus]|uniref:ABC transporter permease n=1 Tax=Macrococcus equipercicus TaxID=69967 RepID=A0A9Q9BWD0_9STAP|nr:ABC transporter permease [Macrococcus equipercicus]KAA1042671.1 ABC transporter permease [Macrococcus equipercicus]UTH14537.1 ABC transporter permease [Macrococcus equipercicus]
MSRAKNYFLIPYLLWIVLFIIMPVVMICYTSFKDMDNHFTLENYRNFLSPVYLDMTLSSFFYALIITVICLIIAYPVALALRNTKNKQFWLLLIILPTWINLLLKTYAFIGILSKEGTVNDVMRALHLPASQLLFTDAAFIIVSVYIYIPFMILPIFNSMDEIPENLLQASRDLGADQWTTFRKVIMPLSWEGVKTGIQVTFIPALSLFMITRLIAGNKVVNLGTAIEEQFLVTQNYGMGSTIAVFLILAMALVMVITKTNKESRDNR